MKEKKKEKDNQYKLKKAMAITIGLISHETSYEISYDEQLLHEKQVTSHRNH